MKTLTKSALLLAASTLALAGCPSDDTGGADGGTDSDSNGTESMTSPTMTGPTTETTPTMSGTSLDTTATETTTTMGMTDSATDPTGDSSTGCDPTVFDFREEGPEMYTQEDSMGFPAVNTALNIDGDGSQKDTYNQAAPPQNMSSPVIASLNILHCGGGLPSDCAAQVNGLRNDLIQLGAVPCDPPSDVSAEPECAAQGGPFVLPDQLSLDLDGASGFPNGRAPNDYVMDKILAVVLLALDDGNGNGTHAITDFEDLGALLGNAALDGLGLNPSTNDVAANDSFPYLADPQ